VRVPTYDYVCVNCGHRLEVLHGVNSAGPTACPDCGGRLRKSFSPPTIHFKGSGWAKVDRRSASKSSKKDPEAAPAGAAGDGGSKAGDDGSSPGESSSTDTSSGPAPTEAPDRPKRSGAEGRKAEAKTKASNAAE
jgi:putative FmdB family regulatory protein